MAAKKKSEVDLKPLATALEEATMQFKATISGGGPELEERLKALESLMNKMNKKIKTLDKLIQTSADEEMVRAIAQEVIRKAFSSMAGGGGPVVD